MCQFFSAIATRDGRVLSHEATDSHENLVDYFGLDDTKRLDQFVRVEYTPKDKAYADLDSYTLRVDENSVPAWFVEQMETIQAECRKRVARMIVTDSRPILLGGAWILAGEARVDRAVNARIIVMYGSSQVRVMSGSSQVRVMSGSSQVREMYDSSQVGEMYDSAQVREMYGSSRIRMMYDSSQVRMMSGSSRIREMYGSSQVRMMYSSSQVRVMSGSSQVREMYDSSQVGMMYSSSQVRVMRDSSTAPRKPITNHRKA